MKVTVYQYPPCGTCRKAMKWLEGKGLETDRIHIVENPPSANELAQFVKQSGLPLKKLFNTSGVVYKEMNLKDKIPAMSEQEQLDLLASNGKLIKRPIVTDGHQVTIGFKEAEFEQVWGR